MKETKFPFYPIQHELKTVKDIVRVTQKTYKDNPVFRYKDGKAIVEKNKDQFLQDVQNMEQLLHALFEKHSHIGLIGKTSYMWVTSYFAIMSSENIAVPFDKELPQTDLLELMEFADLNCLLFDKAYGELAQMAHERLGIDCICIHEVDSRNLPSLLQEEKYDKDWSGTPTPDDVAEIVFTSGTTGKSKGCMITHRNLAVNAMNGSSYVQINHEDSTLSILPINHALEITAGMCTPMCCGVTICINDSLKYLNKNLLLFKPQCMIAVPMVIETFHKTIWREITKQKKETKVRIAMVFIRVLYKLGIDIRRKTFAEILEKLGGNLRLLIVGGAYVNPKIIKEYEAWGINVVQGYGITECAPVVSCNTDRKKKYKSVGKVVTDCEVKISEGEILVSGPIVMKGYYKDQAATDSVFENGWFKTGDLGYLDHENYLYITGRKKNLIILPNGENISPEELELKISSIPYIKEVVVSEQEGVIQAEVFLDEEMNYNARNDVFHDIDAIGRKLPNYKKIARVVIREDEFEKTTTRKIKR